MRSVYDWKGLKLEVDETDFDFGTLPGGAGHWHDRGWRWICRSCYGGTKVKRGTQGQKAKRGKVVKGDSVCVGASQKKIMADITNLDQHQQGKQHPAPLAAPATDISVDQLLKENAILMKLLANRKSTSFQGRLLKA